MVDEQIGPDNAHVEMVGVYLHYREYGSTLTFSGRMSRTATLLLGMTCQL